MPGSSRQVYKGVLDPPPRLREYQERGWEEVEVRARGWQSCRGKGAGFWTAEDHCKHALLGAAVTCAGQASRHPLQVGRGSCGPTLAGDSCQAGRRVSVLRRYRPWQENHEECIRAALTLPRKNETKEQEVELFKKQNQKELGWRYREVGCPGSSWRWEGNIVKYTVSA